MAQKKLLFPLILLLLLGFKAPESRTGGAVDQESPTRFNFREEDLESALKLRNSTLYLSLPAIKEKWFELQDMLGGRIENKLQDKERLASLSKNIESNTAFRIFVSHSMSINLLRNYALQAKKYGAVLVFNGLPQGSWRELSKLVTEISGDKPELVSIQIDDEAFTRFGITNVPSFVLSKEEDSLTENPKTTFDKVSGAVGIRSALALFANAGELKDIADKLLKHEGRK